MKLRPLRNLVHVERLPDLGRSRENGETRTEGGIIVPDTYADRGSRKAINRPDVFRARVLAVGPSVPAGEMTAGDEVLVLSWAGKPDGTRRSLYTGIDAPGDTLLVEYPADIECVVHPVQPREGEHAAE